jgi:hypothetical protein
LKLWARFHAVPEMAWMSSSLPPARILSAAKPLTIAIR